MSPTPTTVPGRTGAQYTGWSKSRFTSWENVKHSLFFYYSFALLSVQTTVNLTFPLPYIFLNKRTKRKTIPCTHAPINVEERTSIEPKSTTASGNGSGRGGGRRAQSGAAKEEQRSETERLAPGAAEGSQRVHSISRAWEREALRGCLQQKPCFGSGVSRRNILGIDWGRCLHELRVPKGRAKRVVLGGTTVANKSSSSTWVQNRMRPVANPFLPKPGFY